MKILLLLFLTFNLLYANKWTVVDNVISWGKEIISVKKTSTVVIAGATTGSSNTPKLEEVTLQTKWFEQFQFAGYYMAQENGYYREKSLKLKILSYVDGINSTDEVVNDKAMYGVGDSSLVKDIIEGKNLVLLKAILQESPIIILSLQSNTLNNSKNKRIMVSREESQGIVFQSILANHSIQLGYDLKPIYQSPNVMDLINNRTDFMIAYKSNEPYLLEGHDIEDYHFTNFDEIGLQFYSDILFTSKKELLEHPNRVKNFTEATMEGWRFAFSNIKKTAEFIHKNYNEQNKSLEAIIYEGKELKVLAIQEGLNFGGITSKSLKNIEHSYKNRGLLDNVKYNTDYNNYIYPMNYFELEVRLEKYKYYFILFLIFLFLLFFTILVFWSLWLKKRVAKGLNKQKEQEESLKEKDDLLIQKSRQLRRNMDVANASHQLKSPINSISSIVNNLQKEIKSSELNYKSINNELTKIKEQSFDMREIVNDFLGKMSSEQNKGVFSISEAIEKYLTYKEIEMKEYGIIGIFENEQDFIYLDYQVDIKQVLHIIIDNTIEALSSDISKPMFKITINEDSQKNIIILISDNGKGIPFIYRKRIFELHFSTKDNKENQGQGLYIAKYIIENKLKGKISVSNDNGAIFKMMLPAFKLTSK